MLSKTINAILDSNKTEIKSQKDKHQSLIDTYFQNLLENFKGGNVDLPEAMRKKLIERDMILRQKNFEGISKAKERELEAL